MLLDLCLDNGSSSSNEDLMSSDESDPAEIFAVADDNAANDNWAQARADCAAGGKHLCRMLNQFAYKKVRYSKLHCTFCPKIVVKSIIHE